MLQSLGGNGQMKRILGLVLLWRLLVRATGSWLLLSLKAGQVLNAPIGQSSPHCDLNFFPRYYNASHNLLNDHISLL